MITTEAVKELRDPKAILEKIQDTTGQARLMSTRLWQ